MKSIPKLALALAVALAAFPVIADEEDALRAQVHKLMAAEDADAQKALIDAIRAAKPDPERVAAYLAEGRTYAADAPTGWLERKNLCPDGVERNYLLFVPEDYTPEKRYRLLFHLHGGVSRPEMLSHADLRRGTQFFWATHAAEHGYLHAIPAGQKDAEWWQPVGARHVLDILRTVKREYNVDENQVFSTGFSDGASGSYYLALAHPTPFAGFIPLNGHVAVAGVRGFQVHLRSLVNKPIYAVNTERDQLYPSAACKPFMTALEGLGATLVWRDVPDFGHDPRYLPEERPAIADWMDEVRRRPHPRRVVWEGDAEAPARRVHWLQVTKVADVGNDEAVEDVNPLSVPGRVLIGITVDQTFEGSGVRVETVRPGTPAQAVGLDEGDVIVELDGAKIEGLDDLRRALSKKTYGDAFTLKFLRDDEETKAESRFPEFEPEPVLRRERPWGSLRAQVEGNTVDVRVMRIAAFDVFLGPDLLDMEKPVVVKVNGQVVHEARVAPDLAFMLARWQADEDRTMLYHARVSVTVPPKTKEKPAEDE